MTTHPVHLILSAGTRIATRNEANRIGGGQLIATGAVASIIESPPDGNHAYKVRFNDGAEAMLRRNEFSILKEFKGEGLAPTASGADFDEWKSFVIYRCIVGSQAFGLSDEDFCLPYIADLVARKQSGENATLPDADVDFHQQEYESLRTRLQAAHDSSQLPEVPSDETRRRMDDLLKRIRLH